MIRLTSLLIITISLLAATRVNAVACGDRTCSTGEQCCADSYMGPTCFNPADHSCPSTSLSAGDSNSGHRLCGPNDSACGPACYDSRNYFCCNQQVKQIGQACAQQTTAPTSAPATTSTPTTQSPPQLNCPGANNFGGVNCSDASLCCGYGTISPSCLPADGSKKCCVHFKSSTQCNQDQVCGGSGGPGASSYAACGPAGTTFCDKGTGQGTFCGQDKPTCCGYNSGFGFCCPDGCACNNNYYNCSCPATTTAPATTQTPTSAPTTVPVTQAPVMNNCPGAANSAGVNCSDASLCCGSGTITPSCLPADGSKKCCTHFLASTQCDTDEVCGGGGGPGASSYAQCGAPGSTYCDKGTGQGTFCTQEKPTCCGYNSGFGFCCPDGCACNNNYYNCSCPSTTTVPTTSAPTNAPTASPTTVAPTQAPVMMNCPGANNVGGVNCSDASLCCGYGTISPSCLPADGSKKCCTHFKAATQCNPDQVCGGSGGPGASSYASCGAPGTTFCDKGTGQGTFCTQEKPTCCGYNSGFGFCCPDGCACNNNYYNCSCPSTTTAPATTAPTSPPATSLPLPTTASTTCGGRACAKGSLCCNDMMNGEICYDPSAYKCAATNSPSSGASGSLLCPSNLDACGSACYNKSEYYCCNNQLRQNGQPCSA